MPDQSMTVAYAALTLDEFLSQPVYVYTVKMDRKDQYKLFVSSLNGLLDITPHLALMAHERLYADGGIRGGIRRIEQVIERVCEDLGHRPTFTIAELN